MFSAAILLTFAYPTAIELLLEDLKNPDEKIRDRATQEFWHLWFMQKGVLGWELLRRAQSLMEAGENEQAEAILTKTIADLPDFAEAWNRRAVLYYTMGEYEKSRNDCLKAIELNPIHFGAFHGLGLCYASLG